MEKTEKLIGGVTVAELVAACAAAFDSHVAKTGVDPLVEFMESEI